MKTHLSTSPTFGVSNRCRVAVVDALHLHHVDGSALLDFTQEDLMSRIGIRQLGIAKAILRAIQRLCDPVVELPAPSYEPPQLQKSMAARPSSAPASRKYNADQNSSGDAIRYAALNPFAGWEEQLSEKRHPKRTTKFVVRGYAARPATAVPTVREAPENSFSFRSSGGEDEMKMNAACMTTENVEEPIDGCCNLQGAPLETKVAETAFRLGPLERERRLGDVRNIYRILNSVVGAITLGWVVEAIGKKLDWEPASFRARRRAIYTILRNSFLNAEHRVTGRPHSATILRTQLQPLLELPSEPSDEFIDNLKLGRVEFRVAMMNLLAGETPDVFDGCLSYINKEHGEARQETARRKRAIEALFSHMDIEREGVARAALINSVFNEFSTLENRQPAPTKRPVSAPTTIRSSLGTQKNSFRGMTSDLDEEGFLQLMASKTEGETNENFDHIILNLRIAVERSLALAKRQEASPGRRLLTTADLECALNESSTATPLLVLVGSNADPGCLLLELFEKRRQGSRGMNRSHLDAIPVGPPPSQNSLLSFVPDSESSCRRAMSAIETQGIDRGCWIYIAGTADSLEVAEQHLPGDLKLKEQVAEQRFTGLLNGLLRGSSRLLLTRTSASVHPSFRLFVHIPLDTLDANNFPLIAKSISVVLKLRQ
jgi:hypothetical protein